jgi:hypothetical protein
MGEATPERNWSYSMSAKTTDTMARRYCISQVPHSDISHSPSSKPCAFAYNSL